MKKRILCFGDSNTWGYIAGSGLRYDETIRWPSKLQELLGPDYIVIEEGLTGRTTIFDDPMSPHLNGYAHMGPIFLTAAPIDILIFMLGTNDFQSHILGNSAVATARAIQFMLEEVQRLDVARPGSEMKTLLISPVEITEDRLSFKDLDLTNESSIQNSRLLGKYLKLVAEQCGCDFLDAAQYIRPSRLDGVHLDAEGHAKLADLVFERVKEY